MRRFLGIATILLVMTSVVVIRQVQASRVTVNAEAEPVTAGALSETVLASGKIAFREEIEIRAELTGRVSDLYVEEGEHIEQGALLARLDDEAFVAEVESTRASVLSQEIQVKSAEERLRETKRQLAAQERLYARNLVQEDTIEKLKSELSLARIDVELAVALLDQAKAEHAVARDLLSKTVFRAPITGLLTSVDIKEGETVVPGTTNIIGSSLMTLSDTGATLAEIRVDEADVAHVRIGQTARVYAASHPRTPIEGEVVKIGSTAKVLGHTKGLSFEVKVLIRDPGFQLYPGMSCRAEIVSDTSSETLKVPIAAIQQESGREYVWVAENGIAHKRYVTTGLATDTEQAVLEGVTLNDLVLTGPSRTLATLAEGKKIDVVRES